MFTEKSLKKLFVVCKIPIYSFSHTVNIRLISCFLWIGWEATLLPTNNSTEIILCSCAVIANQTWPCEVLSVFRGHWDHNTEPLHLKTVIKNIITKTSSESEAAELFETAYSKASTYPPPPWGVHPPTVLKFWGAEPPHFCLEGLQPPCAHPLFRRLYE